MNPMSTHLVDWYEKNMKNYSKVYNHEMPKELAELSKACIAKFREVTAKK